MSSPPRALLEATPPSRQPSEAVVSVMTPSDIHSPNPSRLPQRPAGDPGSPPPVSSVSVVAELVTLLSAKEAELRALRDEIHSLRLENKSLRDSHHPYVLPTPSQSKSSDGLTAKSPAATIDISAAPTAAQMDAIQAATSSSLHRHQRLASAEAVESAVRLARLRVRASPRRAGVSAGQKGGYSAGDPEYVLDSGYFLPKMSHAPLLVQSRGHDDPAVPVSTSRGIDGGAVTPVRRGVCSPKRHVQLFGFTERGTSPGPSSYSPLYNRRSTPPRSSTPKRLQQ